MRNYLILLVIILSLLTGCGGQEPYLETFDETGTWRVGEEVDVSGLVVDGVYRFHVVPESITFWTTAEQEFTDGIFSVEARQTKSLPEFGGYGMMLRVDDNTDSFYLFEISSDGLAWVARCLQACTSDSNTHNLISNWWFETAAINQGIGETNVISVEADNANFIFRINGIEIGRFTDPILTSGDIGLYVETISKGGLEVEFDNVRVEPLP